MTRGKIATHRCSFRVNTRQFTIKHCNAAGRFQVIEKENGHIFYICSHHIKGCLDNPAFEVIELDD